MTTDMSNESIADTNVELLKRVSAGDEEAFRQLYDVTHKKVYFYLYRLLKGKESAEDILVETYTEVWRGAKNFKGKSMVTTWMMGIARNLAMNELRKMKSHDNIDDYPNLPNGSTPDVNGFDRQRRLKEAILRLSTRHQEVLDLVFFHEMTYPEVSEILDIPIGTIKTRVFYAKEALREILNQMGVKRDEL